MLLNLKGSKWYFWGSNTLHDKHSGISWEYHPDYIIFLTNLAFLFLPRLSRSHNIILDEQVYSSKACQETWNTILTY